jgi:hypothetical protein
MPGLWAGLNFRLNFAARAAEKRASKTGGAESKAKYFD